MSPIAPLLTPTNQTYQKLGGLPQTGALYAVPRQAIVEQKVDPRVVMPLGAQVAAQMVVPTV
ncbi:hypothetical protein MTO96_045442, partial [Rhipicephalus appendiculatus]